MEVTVFPDTGKAKAVSGQSASITAAKEPVSRVIDGYSTEVIRTFRF